MRRRTVARAVGCVLAAWMAMGGAWAQTTGTIRGTVKDPSGAVVVGAKVTATLQETKVTRTVAADDSGAYQFAALPVGHYTIEVEVSGFKKYLQTDIELTLGHVVIVDAIMQLGAVTEEITTTAVAPLVETTSTQLGAVMNSRAVVDLPLNARDTYQLLQLQPGVQSQVGSNLFYGSDQAGSVSVNGGRGRSNNFMVNGGDANDQFVNLPAIQPSPDTIQEFRILTNTFDAEFGRNSGSVVDVVTKSGTNSFHGDVFEFLRNRGLNSRSFFDADRADFKQNQFGGTLGGPIRKDKTFFFGSYEGRRIRQGISSGLVTVPTQAERGGDFSAGSAFAGTLTDANVASILNARPGCASAVQALGGAPLAAGTAYSAIFPTNVIPTQCFDPTALDLLNQFVPLPNAGAGLYDAVPNSSLRQDQTTGRIDHQINDRHLLSAYYYFTQRSNFQPFSFFQAAGANVPGFGALYDERDQQVNLTHTWTMSPTTINEFRASFFREAQGKLDTPQHTNLLQSSCTSSIPADQCFSDPSNPSIGITPFLGPKFEGVPFISVSGGFGIGNNFEGQLPQFGNTYQLSDNFTKVVGKHSLKFGVDFRRQQFNQTLYFDVNGDYSYFGGGPNDVGFDNLFPNYLLGLPDSYLQGSAQLEAVRSSSIYAYAQDSWKVRPNVTVNYGLRWELNTPLHDRFNRLQTFRPGQSTTVYPCQLSAASASALGLGNSAVGCNPGDPGQQVFPLGLVVPNDKGIPQGLTQTYYKSFAPRIGLAWSPGGTRRTSIRAGFGLFYNPVEQLVLEQFSAEPPFGGSTLLSNNLFNTPFESQSGSFAPNPFHGILNPPPGQPVDWSLFRPILLFGQFLPRLRSQYAEQYNFTIQRELGRDAVFQVGYVGSQGHRLLVTHDLNFGNSQTCLDLQALSNFYSTSNPTLSSSLACGSFFADTGFTVPAGTIPPGMTLHLPYGSVPSVTGPNSTDITLVGLRPYSSPLCEPTTGNGCPADGIPVFGSVFAQDTIGNSNYHSLQMSLEKRFSRGFQFQLAYTWSKSFDYGSSFEDILNPQNFRRSYSLSQFDSRNRVVLSYVWQLPIKARRGAVGKLVSGWGLSGIVTFQAGFPIRITSSDDIELQNSFDFLTPGEPDLVSRFIPLNPRGPGHYAFSPLSFSEPSTPTGVIGSSARTICCGPGLNNTDFAVLKETSVTENTRVQFRAEFFNLFNQAQFFNPDGNFSDGAQFGQVLRSRDPRLIQFALKFIF